jgi:hypothetical protein
MRVISQPFTDLNNRVAAISSQWNSLLLEDPDSTLLTLILNWKPK